MRAGGRSGVCSGGRYSIMRIDIKMSVAEILGGLVSGNGCSFNTGVTVRVCSFPVVIDRWNYRRPFPFHSTIGRTFDLHLFKLLSVIEVEQNMWVIGNLDFYTYKSG
jgi:hypothetical protein